MQILSPAVFLQHTTIRGRNLAERKEREGGEEEK